MDIAKVDWDVAYVAMAIHVYVAKNYSKCLSVFLDVCCKCVSLNVVHV
jgi:hypothetical protein